MNSPLGPPTPFIDSLEVAIPRLGQIYAEVKELEKLYCPQEEKWWWSRRRRRNARLEEWRWEDLRRAVDDIEHGLSSIQDALAQASENQA